MADTDQASHAKAVLDAISVNIRVSVGSAWPSVSEVMSLGAGSVLRLDRKVSDEVELFVGERLIAKGTLEADKSSDAAGLRVKISELLDTKSLDQ